MAQKLLKNMYALLNVFNSTDDIGQVLSMHRTADAAIAARDKYARQVTAANGPGFYLPMEIVRVRGSRARGQHLYESDVLEVVQAY